MVRMTSKEALEKKIEKAQEKVIRTKAAYDAAVDELQVLLDKQTAMQADMVMRAIAKSNKTIDEILRFIDDGKQDEEPVKEQKATRVRRSRRS